MGRTRGVQAAFVLMAAALNLMAMLPALPALAAHPPASGKKLPPSKARPELEKAREALKKGDKAAAREHLNNAKKILVAEGRYNCCITDGGCDMCALEESCPCGIELNEKDGQGVCKECHEGWQNGKGAYPGITLSEVKLNQGMHAGMGHSMQGMTGDWSMSREASGTSWIPDSSPMYMKMGTYRGLNTMFMGYVYGIYTDQGGPRGDEKLYASSQFMGSAWKRNPNNIIGGRLMLSLDPATMGTRGYPLLFQTGETAFGEPLVDRQHPHDFIMELAGTYTQKLTEKGGAASLYLAAAGEPALGPTAFPHRPSAFDNPEAPLGHHWFDATHITYGVATLGVANNAVKVEGSIFTGREPDENRYDIDTFRWDSYSGRISFNPTRDISGQVSHGFLKEPEPLEPGTNQQRTTASVMYNKPLREGKTNWQTMLGWARNRKYAPEHEMQATDAWLLESAYLAPEGTLFGRIERVDKDELFPASEEHTVYTVNKFTLGGVKNLGVWRGTDVGVGGSLSLYAYPSALEPSYGSSPVSFNLFVRLRTARM
jgi:hypothetical protein